MKFDIDLVGKVGSMALINREFQDIDYNIIARISKELTPGVIWVSSGAIEIGRIDYINRNGKELTGDYSEVKTDYAAQGQTILMNNYRQFIDPKFGVRQILVEHQHFNDERKREDLKKLLLRCPNQNAVPIVNYNDPLSNEETLKMEIQTLQKQNKHPVHCLDNDETAAQIACLVKCKRLLIYTSTIGIYEQVGKPETLIKEINGKDIYELIQNISAAQERCDGASRHGANGAKAKLEYIKAPAENGTEVFIANPKYTIKDILSGNAPCTHISVE